jgi:hypothetical protein
MRPTTRGKVPSVKLLPAALYGVLAIGAVTIAQEPTPGADGDRAATAQEQATPPKLPEPQGAKRLSPEYDVWLDPKEKAVLIDGQISLREGMLEMFACIRNTKEHESIVSANTRAYLAHAALLALGAEPGTPVRYVERHVTMTGIWYFDIGLKMMVPRLPPIYVPPMGTEIEVLVRWGDAKGVEHTARAQDWIRDIGTNKSMTHPFVFAGSTFWVDPETGKRFYQAEGGDFICVSNFSTAMLDIPVESSQANTQLAFEAFTERIPPLGAPVRLVLKPKLKEQDQAINRKK